MYRPAANIMRCLDMKIQLIPIPIFISVLRIYIGKVQHPFPFFPLIYLFTFSSYSIDFILHFFTTAKFQPLNIFL